ncbi:MAG: Maf family protein [Erysipelotrichaceae bacterium]|jgi:septum formation protein|nr:Maf family protein [Erysipelotrichaceae bacterium]
MLVLASTSPRRKALLAELTPNFVIDPATLDESLFQDAPRALNRTLAFKKAEEIIKKHPEAVVLGVDTIVVYQGRILGKPHGTKENLEMLQLLNGKTHQVYTSFALLSSKRKVIKTVVSKVTFNFLSEIELQNYIETFRPFDKAGGYGIQDQTMPALVKKYRGSYTNIMGLPLEALTKVLKRFTH